MATPMRGYTETDNTMVRMLLTDAFSWLAATLRQGISRNVRATGVL
jgi:hypothetical protein